MVVAIVVKPLLERIEGSYERGLVEWRAGIVWWGDSYQEIQLCNPCCGPVFVFKMGRNI